MSGKEREVSASTEVERNLRLLARGGLALFGALTATLFLVQLFLGRQMANLENVALERQSALGSLEASLSALFGREAQMLSSTQASQLAPLRERKELERQFATASDALTRSGVAEDAARLARDAEAMLAADKDLFASLERRHDLQARFEKSLGEVSVQLRATMEQVSAISGVAHLGFIRVLRRLAHNESNGSDVHEVVYGSARVQQEVSADLVGHILNLGVLVGKIGLAPNADTLNSIMANEIAQNVAATRERLTALEKLVATQPEVAARAKTLRDAYEAIVPRIVAEDRPDAMVALRRATFSQQKLAEELRRSTLERAALLTATVQRLQGQVRTEAARAVSRAHAVAWVARALSCSLLLAGIALLVLAARRIRHSFESLRENNRTLVLLKEELVAVNGNLEGLVAVRTAALAERERSMRLILDHTADGLVSIDREGKMAGEVSRAARRWFGEPGAGQRVSTYLFPNQEQSALFDLALSQVADDILPFEVSVAELPARLVREGRTYALSYGEIREDETLRGLLVAVCDVTEQEVARRREEEARELQTVIGHILRSPQGFRTFLDETERWLETLAGNDELDVVMRALHTLKGSAAIYGLMGVARLCHDLESQLVAGQRWDRKRTQDIAAVWERTLANVGQFVQRDKEVIDVGPGDVQLVQEMLRDRADHVDILEVVQSWALEPMRSVLERLGAQAKRIAPSMGKEVEVEIVCDGSRPPKALTPFLSSLVHVVRNAIDHGIELPRERVALGKPRVGRLSLSATVTSAVAYEVVVQDDGGGVDFGKLRVKAAALGLRHDSEQELIEALFVDGFSTREDVTEYSGRGVGLSAVRAAAAAVGAEIRVISGQEGSTFRFVIPVESLRADASPTDGAGSSLAARRLAETVS